MPDAPPYLGDWEALAAFTRKLLYDRRNSYHEEDDRIRVMAAVAEVWRRVEAGQDLPEFDESEVLGAWWSEMLRDIEAMATRAKERADRAATRADVEDSYKRSARTAALLANALLHYHRPWNGEAWGTPLIAFCHGANQQRRARLKQPERQAA